MKIEKPWPQWHVDKLNEYQNDGHYHPYTCPGDKEGCNAHRNLIATKDGWVCKCGEYTQDWSHPHP